MSGAKKYRKRPVVIEAMGPLVASNMHDIARWCGASPTANATNIAVFIHTLEGTMTADEGDFIIRGVHGEFYPCKPVIFGATYEPVEGES